jgi:hypothetical protein
MRPLVHGWLCAALMLISLAVTMPAAAQIPRDEYLRYVPLTYPRIIRQTEASARFHLYGDAGDPSYRDADPKDGIDDGRAKWLNTLATRFAPIMIRNTPQFPMDFRVFYDRDSFSIFMERWDVARATFSLLDSQQVDLATLADNPCPTPGTPNNDDCRLIQLIERFGPTRSPIEPEAVSRAEEETFTIIHLDMPGYDEKTWKENYWPDGPGTGKRPDLAGSERVFAHPFIVEYPADEGGPSEYEFVIQYWFFYPANDGPNNHEGDWEHINVIVSPRSAIGRRFQADDIEQLLSGRVDPDGDDPLVLKRIEYYLHHYVYPMDFSSPNVYQPREDWNREVEALAKERLVRRKLWDLVRERAYRDPAETAINTHPIVWIGGDAVGLQNVIEMPGLKDQDGHPSYPFRGYYKKIGPGAGERVIEPFDHFKYFAGTETSSRVEDYSAPGRIALTPDWERILDLSMTDPDVRRDWAWMLLPMRFGYPASPSPGAGIVAHADMGNVAPIGPSYNNAWNRVGDSAGYDYYEMVMESWASPLGALDSFFPRAGFINAPILYFMLKPPLDLIWRTVALPIRAAVGSRQPTFLPAGAPAVRDVSFEVGPMVTNVNDDLNALFFTREQFPEIWREILALVPPTGLEELDTQLFFGWASAPAYSLVFHISPRFSTESSFVRYKANVGFDFIFLPSNERAKVRGDFHQDEYHGALRFNLMTGSFQPYVKYGHGLTYYRLKNVNVNGKLISQPTSPKFRPAVRWLDLGFNETILGGGVDWSDIRVGRIWIGAKASYTFMHHNIGFERLAAVEDFPFLGTIVAGTKYSIWRQQARFFFNVSW